ncbi:MAG: PQQ-dependent sugar dehydrogenase [Pseudomonadota bacterium]|nr:PQQ-dependent sugar dehydrogenase [Pseudomonadota bacterium]
MIFRALLLATSLLAVPAEAASGIKVETVAEGLSFPWAMAFLPDGSALITERSGNLRVWRDGALAPTPIAGVPQAYVARQGGLFDVLPARDFEKSGHVYLSMAHGTAEANTTRVIRGRYTGSALEDIEVIFDAAPTRNTAVHYGGRMAWLPDGTLVLSLGDGYDFRYEAQDPANHLGTIVRITPDGAVPDDNPFVGEADKAPEVYSYGHRSVQGLAYDATRKTLWAHEHGPRGGDELNRIKPGKNYGWPVATFGVEYAGTQITPHTSRPDMEDPVLHWTPSIAPSGLAVYDADLFAQWKGSLLITALAHRMLVRVSFDDDGQPRQERLLADRKARLRSVTVGPDGAVYVLTDAADGAVLKLTPASESSP